MSKRITQLEYQLLRKEMFDEAIAGGLNVTHETVLTCDDCPQRFKCEFAADLYNTGGDCLAEK